LSQPTLSKKEFAERVGVSAATVRQWVGRAKLSGAAVTASGRIRVDEAERQLRERLDPMRGRPRDATAQQHGGDEPAAARLIEARASAAEIAVERARRRLEHERGVYALAADVEQQRGRGISQLIEATENWLLYDVPALLGIDDAGRAVLRESWRKFRERESQAAAQRASLLPKYVTDPNEAEGGDGGEEPGNPATSRRPAAKVRRKPGGA
jgi:transposase